MLQKEIDALVARRPCQNCCALCRSIFLHLTHSMADALAPLPIIRLFATIRRSSPAPNLSHLNICPPTVAPNELKTCSGCHRVQYCSEACSKAAWKVHKIECKKSKQNTDMLEEIAMDQPYEVLLKKQFASYCEAISPWIAGELRVSFAELGGPLFPSAG